MASALFGLGIALYYYLKVANIPLTQGIENSEEAEKLTKIHGAIARGAMAFLKAEYKYMVYFMAGFAIVIALLIDDPHTPEVNEGIYTAISFFAGLRHFDCFRLYRNADCYYWKCKNNNCCQKFNCRCFLRCAKFRCRDGFWSGRSSRTWTWWNILNS